MLNLSWSVWPIRNVHVIENNMAVIMVTSSGHLAYEFTKFHNHKYLFPPSHCD